MRRAHTPTASFRSSLEATIREEVKRVGGTRRTPTHRLRMAAIITAAVALGALAGAAPAQVQDARTRSELLVAAQAEEELLKVRFELARAALVEARRKHEVGVITPEALANAEAELRAMEIELRRNQLVQEEIRASSAPPRDEISAPLVNGRDFVRERLELEMALAQQQMVAAERRAAEVSRLQRVGAAAPSALLDAELELTRARHALQTASQRTALRSEFLARGMPAAEVEEQLRRMELVLSADLARAMHVRAEQRLRSLREMEAAGAADRLDVMRAEVELMERAHELQQIAKRLEAMKASRDR